MSVVALLMATVYFVGKRNIHSKSHDLSMEARKDIMSRLFSLSDFDHSGEIDREELLLLFDFVADMEFEEGRLQHEVDALNDEEMDRIMLEAGAEECPAEPGVWKLSRSSFIQATFHAQNGYDQKDLAHFVPVLQATEQVKEQTLRANVMSIGVQLFLFLHTPISAKAFQYFDCHQLGSLTLKLRADYQLNCDGQAWLSYLPVALMLLFGFAFALPMALGYIVFVHRKSFHAPSTQAKIGWLYDSFNDGSEYWEVHEIVRKTALTGVLLFIPEDVRGTAALIVCIIACCELNYYRPQRNVIVFWIAQGAFMITTLKYLVTVVGMSELNPLERVYLGRALIVVDLLIFLAMFGSVFLTYYLMRNAIKRIQREEREEKEEAEMLAASNRDLGQFLTAEKTGNARSRKKNRRSGTIRKDLRKKISIRGSMERVLLSDAAQKVQESAAVHKNEVMKKIHARARAEDERLRQRLGKRRKHLQDLHTAGGVKIHPVDRGITAQEDLLFHESSLSKADIQRGRERVKAKVRTEARLVTLIKSMDVSYVLHGGSMTLTMTKGQFNEMCMKVLSNDKKIVLTPELLIGLWLDAWSYRKHEPQGYICENTLRFWLMFADNVEDLNEEENAPETKNRFLKSRSFMLPDAFDVEAPARKRIPGARIGRGLSLQKAKSKIFGMFALGRKIKKKELSSDDLRNRMSALIKNQQRLSGIVKAMNLSTLSKPEFIKFCQKVLKNDKRIDTSPASLTRLWNEVYELRKDKSKKKIAQNELCSWLKLKMSTPSAQPEALAEIQFTQNKAGALSKATKVDLSADAKKIKALLSIMIKSEKRLVGIMKMIDKDASNALSKDEFETLCRKVLKKDQSVKPTEEDFDMLWSDVYSLRKDPSHTEIGNNELCVWLELKMNKPAITTETSAVETPQESAPAESAATTKAAAKSEAATCSAATADDSVSADVKKVKAVLSTTIKSEKRLAGIMKMIDVDNSQSLNKEEFEKLCRKVLKKDKSIKPTAALFDTLWSEAYKLRKDPSQAEIGSEEICTWLILLRRRKK